VPARVTGGADGDSEPGSVARARSDGEAMGGRREPPRRRYHRCAPSRDRRSRQYVLSILGSEQSRDRRDVTDAVQGRFAPVDKDHKARRAASSSASRATCGTRCRTAPRNTAWIFVRRPLTARWLGSAGFIAPLGDVCSALNVGPGRL